MRNLLRHELKLVVHPTNWIFLALSAMLLIPNYPYYVVFFYGCLGFLFTFTDARENQDLLFLSLLPLGKRDLVKSRFLLVILFQLAQMLAAVPFALLRQSFAIPGNAAGMDAGIALFGLALPMLGIFNRIFLGSFFRQPDKVGTAFLRAAWALRSTWPWRRPLSSRCPSSGTVWIPRTRSTWEPSWRCWPLERCSMLSSTS